MKKTISYLHTISMGTAYAVIFPYYGSRASEKSKSLGIPLKIFRKKHESEEKFRKRVQRKLQSLTDKLHLPIEGQLWVRFVPAKSRIIEHNYTQKARTRS